MKVLSLLQPWATATMTPSNIGPFAIKSWETRSWKPNPENLKRIQTEGMLIHASKKITKAQRSLLLDWPFNLHRELRELPTGQIIGWVQVGRILTTTQWMNEIRIQDRDDERWAEEEMFGNYNPGRYAWELLKFEKFKDPIPATGSLNLWDYEPEINMYYHLRKHLRPKKYKCDVCGRPISDFGWPVYDEQFNEIEGLRQCSGCRLKQESL